MVSVRYDHIAILMICYVSVSGDDNHVISIQHVMHTYNESS